MMMIKMIMIMYIDIIVQLSLLHEFANIGIT